MKRLFQIFLAALVCALSSPAFADIIENYTITDFVKGDKIPKTLDLKDLPEGSVPVSIVTEGATSSNPMDNMFTSFFGMFGGLMSAGTNGENSESNAVMSLMKVAGYSFTNGNEVMFAGQRCLICYKLDFDIFAMAAQSAAAQSQAESNAGTQPATERKPATSGLRWKLQLLREDKVVSMTHEPSVDLNGLFKSVSDLMESGGQAKEAAKKTATLSNMKQVCLATIMYAGDNDDLYPGVQSTASARAVLLPYVKNKEVFQSQNPAKSEFRFNCALASVNAEIIEYPAETILWYETTPWEDGSRIIGYTDGHAKSVGSSEWEDLEPTLRNTYPRSAGLLPMDYMLDSDPLKK
ncbi:MAG: hypothetical protein JST40_07600 [Armatimonadetes bacterium]|nr:hypothetical protein [Armatimonadota bacterium]